MSSAKINHGSFNDNQALVSQPILIILMPSKILCGNFSTSSLLEDFQAAFFSFTHWKNFHPRVTVDQAEGLCNRITLHFGRLNIETGALYYCI